MRKKFRFLTVLAVCVMVLSCFSVTAFAYADDTEQNLPVTEATQPEQQPETTPAPEKPKGEPIDDEGNAYTRDLLYDKATNKQFITVQTKSGNTFFIEMCIRDSSPYVDKYITNPPADYDFNPEYLNDEKFAALITEAEKYLGYPYVWGGSNPDTSFDCSGFVSYVLTNSGLVNTGRLGAQGLYNVCTPVSKANAQPGDLIFFVGTYDTPGVSHVGIYVGDGVMIHCGDPIQYTSINSSYWQQHFYAFGRPAY